ncbi:MAG: methyl-accepting chemotaxis protein [Rhizobiaceae bacterium]
MSDASDIAKAGGGFVRASLATTGKWAGALGIVGGFIADVLNPLAPFAAYISMIAAVAAFIIAIAIVFRLVLAQRVLPALVFATTTAAIAGGIYGLQQAEDARDGLIASLVPAVAELQKSVGLVAAKVENIQKTVTQTQQTVTETKQTVDTVKQSTDQIAAGQAEQVKQTEQIASNQAEQTKQIEQLNTTTEKIAVSIDTVAKGFAALAANGGTIADPKRPDEFYHNARVQELGGDMLNARRSYLAFANFDVDAIDPYLRFATLLRVQDGRAGAREVFGQLAEKGKASSLKLAHLLQFDDAQRLEKLNAFIAANPDFAPAYYLLSQEYSEDRLGSQGLSDKRAEATALEKFASYEKDGGLLKYFVDQTELAAWLDNSRRRLVTLDGVLDPARFAPTLTPTRSNQGWMMTIVLPEAATSISWRLGVDGPFIETGVLAMHDQRTGKPMPNPSFEIPSDTKATTIGVKYLDLRGNVAGPFDIRFDPEQALSQGNKQILDQFWTSWIAFDASDNRGLVYFTHMLSYRCAIKEVHYSLNGATLDKKLEMPPCNEKDPYAIPDNFMPFFKVGDDVKSMSVQITYADGSQSAVREFRRQ